MVEEKIKKYSIFQKNTVAKGPVLSYNILGIRKRGKV